MNPARVLVVLATEAACMRGILRGFMAVAHERDWTLLYYPPGLNLDWVAGTWTPDAVVFGPELESKMITRLAPAAMVSVTVDRSATGIASVCPDEEGIAALALDHLLTRGFRHLSTFRYDESPFAVARERAFIERAREAGADVAAGWGDESFASSERQESPAAMVAWLRSLPKPCGIFTCADSWGHPVARYAREAELRVPEDLALVGVDNDELLCELLSPPLSSVMIPWEDVGRQAATLVRLALGDHPIAGRSVVVYPIDVAARRSSDALAIDDALVATAVAWIREHADHHLTVTMVARAVGGGRQRLERRFRRSLDRTVQQEIRRAHVETAKHWLVTTRASMSEVAERSGFTNASLLNAAFRREVGMPPGVYRRRVQAQREKSAGD